MPDLVDSIIEYEDGSLSAEGTLRLFSDLVRSGMAWTLQGHYGRMARDLIEAGLLTKDGTIISTIPKEE